MAHRQQALLGTTVLFVQGKLLVNQLVSLVAVLFVQPLPLLRVPLGVFLPAVLQSETRFIELLRRRNDTPAQKVGRQTCSTVRQINLETWHMWPQSGYGCYTAGIKVLLSNASALLLARGRLPRPALDAWCMTSEQFFQNLCVANISLEKMPPTLRARRRHQCPLSVTCTRETAMT